jgi:HSP20 family protein
MTDKTLEKARRETPEWFPDLFGRRLFEWFDNPIGTLRDMERMIKVEEFVDGKELVVRAEMPGIDPDKDVEVHVRNHVLEIRAERTESEEKKEKEKATHRSEFRYGSFYRAVALPPDATEHDVHATYKDGILEVRVPLDQKQADATKVEVTRS